AFATAHASPTASKKSTLHGRTRQPCESGACTSTVRFCRALAFSDLRHQKCVARSQRQSDQPAGFLVLLQKYSPTIATAPPIREISDAESLRSAALAVDRD